MPSRALDDGPNNQWVWSLRQEGIKGLWLVSFVIITSFEKNLTALSPAPIAWENPEVVPSISLRRFIPSSSKRQNGFKLDLYPKIKDQRNVFWMLDIHISCFVFWVINGFKKSNTNYFIIWINWNPIYKWNFIFMRITFDFIPIIIEIIQTWKWNRKWMRYSFSLLIFIYQTHPKS